MIKNILIEGKKFYKKYEKEILIGTAVIISIGAAIGVTSICLNKSSLNNCSTKMNISKKQNSLVAENTPDLFAQKTKITTKEVNVPDFIRTLHEGHHPSAAKVAEAMEKGIELAENQTLVDSYNYNRTYIA